MSKSKIFVVIPVYNRLSFTKRCLTSIFNQTYENFEVVLIDDGSTDNTQTYVQKNFPKVKIIQGDGNWWWTKSMYKGVQYARRHAKTNDYLLEMNNDLYFSKNYFQALIDTAKKYKNSIIGSVCVHANKPQEVVEAGIRIDWPTGLVYSVAETISKRLSYYKNMEIIDNVDALPGKGTLIPLSVFNKGVNFKYKLFPHYIADYEFAINAKKGGYNLIVSTSAIAKHYWEATGISGKPKEKRRGYIRALNLLFSRKSMNNIVDWVRFINEACPKEYKVVNYYYSFWKIVKAILTVFPFYYLIPVFRILLKIYYAVKLFSYRSILKVKQFREYHLQPFNLKK